MWLQASTRLAAMRASCFFRVMGLGFGVKGLGFRVEGLGLRV